MISVYKLENKISIPGIAMLHKKAFKGFFLTKLGVPFLKTLYTGFFEDDKSGILIAKDKDKLIGFLAYSEDYPLFFKRLIKKHIIRFAVCSAGAAIKHPSFIKRILGAFKKSDEVKKDDNYVELASICVDPDCENHGTGTALIDKLKSMIDFNKFAYISLETDAENNDLVNKFYVKNGFALKRTYKTGEGRLMNEYTFCPEEI